MTTAIASAGATLGDVWYTTGEDGHLRSLRSSGAESHGMRCSCSECVNERDALREAELLALLGERAGWATRSWDGPLANFPGHSHDDSGPPRRVKRHIAR